MEAGYSRREFADLLGINENTLINRLKGRSSFRLDEVYKICDILHITGRDDIFNIFFGKMSQKQDSVNKMCKNA